MPKFNDFDMSNWKEINDIDVGSLWIIDKRKKDEYNSNNYHGNFVPQIPEHFIKRFTHSGDVVLDPFIGSGTTIFEACRLGRKAIGVDLTPKMFEWINSKKIDDKLYSLIEGDSLSKETYSEINKMLFEKFNTNKVQLLVLHPPYHDIIKFSEKENDMSNCENVDDFLLKFEKLIDNMLPLLEDNRYCVLVMGDKYENSQWIPLAFYCMNVLINKGLILKGTIIKNSVNTKGKAGSDNIWKYRALASDYYLFKHEYIFLFKKVKVKKKERKMITNETQKKIIEFRDSRNWKKYHNGKDLAISISLEASELLEIFQWSAEDLNREEKLVQIKEELADVLIYCQMMADYYGLDMDEIINEKLIKNLKKYPENLEIDLKNK